jgi:O-antigen/teichoic acid export membrane protein
MFTLMRLKQSSVARNSAASYFAFVSTSVSGLLSIPVAVAYLGKEEIGLWAAVNAMIGYLIWMDLGIGVAAGRMLAPSITARDQEEINRWWSVIQVSLWVLGIIVMVLALLCTPIFMYVFRIPSHLQKDAWILLIGCAVISGINFPLRAIPGFLTAEDRFHWVPVCQGLLPWTQLGGFYFMLRMGHGLTSYVWGTAASQLFVFLFYQGLVATSSQRPKISLQGISLQRIRSLLSLSVNLSALGLANSLLQSIPTMILSRHGGLASIPIYTFTSRAPLMASGLVGRNLHAFYPTLLRLHVSGDHAGFIRRFKFSAELTLALGTIAAGLLLALNKSIVCLLAGPGFFAGFSATAWFALGAFVTPMAATAASLLQISGKMGKTILFTVLNLVAVYFVSTFCYQRFGIPGLAAIFSLQVLAYSSYAFHRGVRNIGYRFSDFPKSLWVLPLAIGTAIIASANLITSRPSHSIIIQLGSRDVPLPGFLEVSIASTFVLVGALLGWKALHVHHRHKNIAQSVTDN